MLQLGTVALHSAALEKGGSRKICLKLFCRPTFLLIHLQEANHFKGSTEERNIFPLRSFKRKGPLDRKEILVIQLSRVQCTQQKKRERNESVSRALIIGDRGALAKL